MLFRRNDDNFMRNQKGKKSNIISNSLANETVILFLGTKYLEHIIFGSNKRNNI